MPGSVLGIRHGEVENPGNLIYARLPGYRLSEHGREAAGKLATALAQEDVGAVWASPLDRAVETAEILARPHGVPVRTDDRLLEWSFWTRWQGTPWAEVRDLAPEVFSLYADDPGSLCPEDPLEEVGKRMLSWVSEAAAGQGLVLAVSHEAPLAAAYLVGSGRPMRDFAAVHVPHLGAVRLDPPPAEILDIGVNGPSLGAE